MSATASASPAASPVPTSSRPDWTHPSSSRIWRVPGLSALSDEGANAGDACSDAALKAVVANGFTGIWFFCNLYDLMDSTVFPTLNRPATRDRHLAGLQRAIDRAVAHGLETWLYFNEPAGVPKNDPFWLTHEHLRGEPKWNLHALCTSTPEVLAFARQAIDSVFQHLRGVTGVMLITACENLTHCWSKINVRTAGQPPPVCPRCRDREPADLVLDLLRIWSDLGAQYGFRIWAWNWEWAYWYADPPTQIVRRLPPGVELLLDLEIGGAKQMDGRTVPITEYSLSYVGPSPRLTTTQDAVADLDIPCHAKIQIDSTHELCTVPNLPVLATLHGKLLALTDRRVNGFLGCWSIGVTMTLNTFAFNLFRQNPGACRDETTFLRLVAAAWYGGDGVTPLDVDGTRAVLAAWRAFSDGFAHYPFDIPILYRGPHNDAPGRAMSLHFTGTPIGSSYQATPPGDDLDACRGTWSVDSIIAACTAMAHGWLEGLEHLRAALAPRPDARSQRDLAVAEMIGITLHSMRNHWRFHRERQRVMAAHQLVAPCDLPRDPALLAIIADELFWTTRALPLTVANPDFGLHEEYQGWKYTHASLVVKVAALRATLDG